MLLKIYGNNDRRLWYFPFNEGTFSVVLNSCHYYTFLSTSFKLTFLVGIQFDVDLNNDDKKYDIDNCLAIKLPYYNTTTVSLPTKPS